RLRAAGFMPIRGRAGTALLSTRESATPVFQARHSGRAPTRDRTTHEYLFDPSIAGRSKQPVGRRHRAGSAARPAQIGSLRALVAAAHANRSHTEIVHEQGANRDGALEAIYYGRCVMARGDTVGSPRAASDSSENECLHAAARCAKRRHGLCIPRALQRRPTALLNIGLRFGGTEPTGSRR